ncbi:MAG: HAMP domain-containing sensor histidine kinase [Nevskia sp.]|nr:HAMP domain-containing sensor histidine kinase [Nevskia sp.]
MVHMIAGWLSDPGFLPHGYCLSWRASLLWPIAFSQAMIGISYFSIPVTLVAFIRRHRELSFDWVFLLFGAFILACGVTHFVGLADIWFPAYRLDALVLPLTAALSFSTAVCLWPLLPKVSALIRERAQAQQRLIELNARRMAQEQLQRLNESLVAQVAETRIALRELQQAQAQLVQSEKLASLGGLVAGIAHEVNTPVGVGVTAASTLLGAAQALRQRFAGNTMTRSDLDRFLAVTDEGAQMILKNLQRAADLINSFKQVAVDQSSDQQRPFELKAYIEEVLLSLHPQLKRADVEVTVNCPAPLVLDSYPGSFAQIITNLVTNSMIHAFPPGRSGNAIRIDLAEGDGSIELAFADNGTGITPEHLPKIFDPFFTTRRNSGGSGLGLHIVYNLVSQRLGGRIEVDSEAARGTRFRIRIPRGARPA